MTDAELREQTDVFRERLADGETLEHIMPEAFAVVREAAKRVIGQRHFDVQVMGGAALHMGYIAEMKTGAGMILAQMPPAERRAAYAADITYGTNNEFGFDYLRDNMAWSRDDLVQRGHSFALVDEVDSILIDEAWTPLIISGPAEQSARWD